MDANKNCWSKIFIIILSLSAIKFSVAENLNEKLKVDIFYESRCPDSRNFMQKQLKPNYARIKDKVQINYVPFGKAYSYNYSDGIRFSCQHGQRECDGNVFQNCVLDMIGSDRQDVQTNFVICAMDFTKNPAICAKNIGIDVQKANECAHGNKGIQLQLKAEKDSANVISKSSFVPTIVYNNAYNAGEFWESLDDFNSIVDNKLRRS